MGHPLARFRPRLHFIVIGVLLFCIAILFTERNWIRERYGSLVFAGNLSSPHQITTRVYDVRDIIIAIPDFSGPPDFDFRKDRAAEEKELPTRQQMIDDLLSSILNGIARDSWKANGGSIGAIRELGGQLIVTQTNENQSKALRYLEFVRIRIRAMGWLKWLVLTLVSTVCFDLLLQYRKRRSRQRRGECLHCGYDLRALSERYPECGRPFTPPSTPPIPAVA